MMLTISPLMTLIAFIILPVSAILMSTVVKFSQKYFRTQQEYLGHINGQVEESYGGHLVIKAFNKEKDMVKTFEINLFLSCWLNFNIAFISFSFVFILIYVFINI